MEGGLFGHTFSELKKKELLKKKFFVIINIQEQIKPFLVPFI